MLNTKEVYFDEYCSTCKHEALAGHEEPCTSCLERPYNYDSHKPFFWEEDESKKPAKVEN